MVEKLSKWKCVRVQGDKLRLVFDWSFNCVPLPPLFRSVEGVQASV